MLCVFYSAFFPSPFFHVFAVVRRRDELFELGRRTATRYANPRQSKIHSFFKLLRINSLGRGKPCGKLRGIGKRCGKLFLRPVPSPTLSPTSLPQRLPYHFAVYHKVYHTTAFGYFGYFQKEKAKKQKKGDDCPPCHPKAYGYD